MANDQIAVVNNLRNERFVSTEKRLVGSFHYMQQLVRDGLISHFTFIPGELNVADAMTKAKPCNALQAIVQEQYLMLADGKEMSLRRARKQNKFVRDEAVKGAEGHLGKLE